MTVFGSFLLSLWSWTNQSLLGSKEPTLLWNHVGTSWFGAAENQWRNWKRTCTSIWTEAGMTEVKHNRMCKRGSLAFILGRLVPCVAAFVPGVAGDVATR